jgi:hypothetical protein
MVGMDLTSETRLSRFHAKIAVSSVAYSSVLLWQDGQRM